MQRSLEGESFVEGGDGEEGGGGKREEYKQAKKGGGGTENFHCLTHLRRILNANEAYLLAYLYRSTNIHNSTSEDESKALYKKAKKKLEVPGRFNKMIMWFLTFTFLLPKKGGNTRRIQYYANLEVPVGSGGCGGCGGGGGSALVGSSVTPAGTPW